jgi:hypothetical protein
MIGLNVDRLVGGIGAMQRYSWAGIFVIYIVE